MALLRRSKRLIPLSILSLCGATALSHASFADDSAQEDFFSMSLEELTNIEITSVSKREEQASKTPVAIHVITQEDIARSGATSIPEALRLAPGVNVARAASGEWAISIRGFNAQFSNKLLVLIDGRSVYTPIFSGVFWGVQDTLMEDIERIEVIRGPGGTVWGANAMNGVINIITKEASKTQGTAVTSLYGTHEQSSSARYGGTISENTQYRGFVKHKHNRNYELANGADAGDKWDQMRAGMRVDSNGHDFGDLSFQSELYTGTEDSDFFLPSTGPSPLNLVDDKFDTLGGHVLAQWNYQEDSDEYSVIAYYDFAKRDTFIFEDETHQFDIDFNHSFDMWDSHSLIWGLGYRLTISDLVGTDYLSFSPARRTDSVLSAFLQDKISLSDSVKLTLGSKFEYNDYTQFEWQPSARVGWDINESNFMWASFSKAIRTPGRNGHNSNIAVGALSTPNGPAIVRQIGNEQTDSEELYAYEVGYRTTPVKDISLDVTAFFHDYTTLGGDSFGSSIPCFECCFRSPRGTTSYNRQQ